VEDELRCVVLVTATLDSRAFRLGLPENATVFELDQPAVLDFKQRSWTSTMWSLRVTGYRCTSIWSGSLAAASDQ
jgi:O-methyltransferase involved in polyketide biosynthesis